MPGDSALMEWQGFFFDFDGVVADSVEVKTRAFARLFEPYGPEIVSRVIDHHRRNSGITRVEKFHHYHREFLGAPLGDQEIADLCQRFARLVVDEVVAAPEIAGVEEFLQTARLLAPCFVVSAAPEAELREIVHRRGIDHYFQEILGAPAGKQENLRTLLTRYQLQPGRCLFFGDAASDYRAAKTCQVNFCGVLPNEGAPLLKAAPEIYWVNNFLDIDPGKLAVLLPA